MAVHTDFLLASPAALRRAFRGWGEPLVTPRRIAGRNPATGAAIEWPDWSDPSVPPDDAAPPPDLAGLRVVARDRIDPIKVAALARAAKLDDIAELEAGLFRPALIAPPEHEGSLHAIPDRLTETLASLDPAGTTALARRWSEIERADLGSIPDPSARAHALEVWTEEVFRDVCVALAELCRSRTPGEHLYLSISY